MSDKFKMFVAFKVFSVCKAPLARQGAINVWLALLFRPQYDSTSNNYFNYCESQVEKLFKNL